MIWVVAIVGFIIGTDIGMKIQKTRDNIRFKRYLKNPDKLNKEIDKLR